jgi:alpha-glucosidase (family GH31 glycosyl hydrolase)
MIRHRPFGSGHPYADTGDQRVPARPEHDQTSELRVRASDTVVAIEVEWATRGPEAGSWTSTRIPADPPRRVAEASTVSADGGHLTAAQAKAVADQRYWSVTTPVLDADMRYRYRFHGTYANGRGVRTRWFDMPVARWQDTGGHLEVAGPDRVVPGSVQWLVDADGPQRVRFALPLAVGEHVVGFGERYDAVDQRGRRLDAVVFEQYKHQEMHGRTYIPMPFAMVVAESGASWGFHVRTSRRTWYDVGASTPDRLIIDAEVGGDPKLVLRLYDGAPSHVLDAFLDEVGRPEVLPDWVLGLWASGNEWNTQARVMDEVDRHRDEDIPVSAVVIEAWSDEATFTAWRDAKYTPTLDGAPHRLADFSFPADGAWPDPKGMIEELHDRDIRLVLWQIPLMQTRKNGDAQLAADLATVVEQGLGITEASGRPYRNRGWWFPQALMPDLSTQGGRDWWAEKRRYLVEDMDIDGFKTDGGEHAWGHDLCYADGRRGDEGNNLFAVHYARTYGDLLRSAGKAPVTFSRAGFTGSQAHGLYWAGDQDSTWESLRAAIVAGITASACGVIYWGWDIGGFSGEVPGAELYLRATAAATFMPVMQYHAEFNHHRLPRRDRTPWNIAERTGDERVVPVFRGYAHLRQRLVPYLADSTRAVVATGSPLMRGLFFDHAADPAVWAHPHQFLLGPDLLVAPVTTPGATVWTTYLPAGQWVDVWTGAQLDGAQEVVSEVPLERIPVFARTEAWADLARVFEDAR